MSTEEIIVYGVLGLMLIVSVLWCIAGFRRPKPNFYWCPHCKAKTREDAMKKCNLSCLDDI